MTPTGLIDSWRGSPADWGPVYPFVGFEGALLVICATVFIGFLVWKFRNERARYDREVRGLRSSQGSGTDH